MFEMVKVTSIGDKMREYLLRWFGYVQCRPLSAPVRKGSLVRKGSVTALISTMRLEAGEDRH